MRIREYLSFTKRERYGIVALLIILALVAFLPQLIPKSKPEPLPVEVLQQLRDKGSTDSAQGAYRRRAAHYEYEGANRYGPRYGDFPSDSAYRMMNNALRYHYSDRSRWERGKVNRNYYGQNEYYGRNGDHRPDRFRRREYQEKDRYLSDRYRERRSYGDGRKRFSDDAGKPGSSGWKNVYSNTDSVYREYTGRSPGYRKRHYEAVDINAADTAAFIALPGIGSKLAARIVLFRDKLGGFDRVEQIRDVYGLKDSVYLMLRPYLKCDSVYAGKGSLSYNGAR